MTVFPSLATVRDILPGMARRRYQMPNVRMRGDVKRPYWFVPYRVDVRIGRDTERRGRAKFLGYASGPDRISKREAERRRDEFLKTVNRSDYVLQSQTPFVEFLRVYRTQHMPTLAVSTQEKYRLHLDNHILPEFGSVRLMDIDTERIDGWLKRKADTGLSHATRCDLRNILSGIFAKAERWGYWKDRNPAQLANPGRKRAVRPRRKLTEEQIGLLLAELPEDVRAIVEMGLFYTLRISEILGLQEKHFDFAQGLIRVEQRYYRGNLDVAKSARSARLIPIGVMGAKLKQRMSGNPEAWVFSVVTRFGDSRDDRDINQHFLRPAAKRLGIYYPGFGFHVFRHEAITALGVDPLQAQRIAGHSRADMTGHYTLDVRERQEKAIREHQERILKALEPKLRRVK